MHDLKITSSATTSPSSASSAAPGAADGAAATTPAANQTSPSLRRLERRQDLLTSWDLVAQAVDRILFAVFVLVDVIFLAVYLRGG